jgi:hypothetical protein
MILLAAALISISTLKQSLIFISPVTFHNFIIMPTALLDRVKVFVLLFISRCAKIKLKNISTLLCCVGHEKFCVRSKSLDVQPSTTRTTDRKPFSDIKGKNSQS